MYNFYVIAYNLKGMEDFTKDELDKIKEHFARPFKSSAPIGILVILLSVFISPLLPGRRSSETLADSMGYWNAVLTLSIVFIAVIIYAIKKTEYLVEEKYSNVLPKLKKELIEGEIRSLYKTNLLLSNPNAYKVRVNGKLYDYISEAPLVLKNGDIIKVVIIEPLNIIVSII